MTSQQHSETPQSTQSQPTSQSSSQGQTQPQSQSSDQRPQTEFDTTFLSLAQQGMFSQGGSVDWAREYFDSLERRIYDWEQQVRSARRVAEVTAINEIKSQFITQCAQVVRQQVMAELRRDPSLLEQSSSR